MAGWRGPSYDGEFPSLGWDVLDWAEKYLKVPDGPLAGQALVLTDEQSKIVVRFYGLDDRGKWLFRRASVRRAKGWGKALALDEEVPTPTGWSTMGDLAAGDQVFDERGNPCRVLAKSPIWADTDCWAVTFSDGSRITASGDHLWTLETLTKRDYPTVTIATRDLASRLRRGDGACNWRLPMPEPLQLSEADLPLDPYVLGAWLGDGDSDGQRITSADPQIIDEIGLVGFEVREKKGYRWSVLGLSKPLRALGVLNNKHVPALYLRASEKQRLALLQGLMDTDGSVYDQGVCEFTTTSVALRDGVSELLASFGIKFSCYEGRARLNGRDCGAKWRLKFTAHADMPVFRLDRKTSRLRPTSRRRALHRTRRVVNVERVPTVPTVCIEVDSPSNLFLVGRRMVQTHNSPLLGLIALAELCGPSRFGGWDKSGEPIAVRPQAPWVQVAAVSEDQTENTYAALYAMVNDSELAGTVVDVGLTRLFLIGETGRLEAVTASAGSREGQRITFAVLDETHLWTRRNGGQKLAATIRRNAGKMNGRTFESTNAPIVGEDSVAERTFKASQNAAAGLLYDAVEAPHLEDLTDGPAVRAALEIAYGDSSADNGGWIDLDRLVMEISDPSTDPTDARRFYFNQLVSGGDCPFDMVLWDELAVLRREIPDGIPVGIGFDGSISDDRTVIYGCALEKDKPPYVFEIASWQRPPNVTAWRVPRLEVAQTMRDCFARWRCYLVGDPPLWRTELEGWEVEFGEDHVEVLDTNQARRFAPECDRFATEIRDRAFTHDASLNLRGALAASMRKKVRLADDDEDGRSSWVIVKADARKIDDAVGAILARTAASRIPELKPIELMSAWA